MYPFMLSHCHPKRRSVALIICGWILLLSLITAPLQAVAASLTGCGEACCHAGGRHAATPGVRAADNRHACCCCPDGAACHLAPAASVDVTPAVVPGARLTRTGHWVHRAISASSATLSYRPASVGAVTETTLGPSGPPLYIDVCRLII
jgi:hypothetical protein